MNGMFDYEPYLFGLLFVVTCFLALHSAHKEEWNLITLLFVAGFVALLGTIGISCTGRLIALIVFSWQQL